MSKVKEAIVVSRFFRRLYFISIAYKLPSSKLIWPFRWDWRGGEGGGGCNCIRIYYSDMSHVLIGLHVTRMLWMGRAATPQQNWIHLNELRNSKLSGTIVTTGFLFARSLLTIHCYNSFAVREGFFRCSCSVQPTPTSFAQQRSHGNHWNYDF